LFNIENENFSREKQKIAQISGNTDNHY